MSPPRSERKVVDALVIRKLVEDPFVVKKLVELLFVVDALVAKKLVAVALAATKLVVLASVKYPVTAVIPVVDALVSTDDDAKMFCVKVFRKRRVEEPSENDTSADGVVFPAICSLSVGAVTPMPIRPFDPILNHEDPDEEATAKMLATLPAVPLIASLLEGVDDPIPMFPLDTIVKSEAPVEDATLKSARLEVEVACTLKTYEDEVALIPVNTPLSMSVDVPRVVAESQRVA